MSASRFAGSCAPGRAIRDEAGPVGVDVELHRANGAGADHDRRERADGLVVGGRVDQVPVTVDTDGGAPHHDRVAERRPPLGAVGEVRVRPAAVDDQRQVLTGVQDVRSDIGSPVPRDHVDAAAAIAQNCRRVGSHRRVGPPVVGEAATGILELEGAVEGRDEAGAHRWRYLSQPPRGHRHGRFGKSRIQHHARARVVDPGQARDKLRIVRLGAEARDQHRRARAAVGEGRVPHALAWKRRVDHRLDVRWAIAADRWEVESELWALNRCDRDGARLPGQRLQSGAAFARGAQRVVDVLDAVDQAARAVVPQPLDGPNPDARIGWSGHRGDVGNKRRHEAGHGGDRRDPASARYSPTGAPRTLARSHKKRAMA